MRTQLIIVAFMLFTLMTSCNQSKIKNLENELYRVEQERDEAMESLEELQNELYDLHNQVSDLQDEVYELESELQVCEFGFEQYKEGQGVCVTRYWKGIGRRTICGAENIMDMYEKGYCIFECKYTPDY